MFLNINIIQIQCYYSYHSLQMMVLAKNVGIYSVSSLDHMSLLPSAVLNFSSGRSLSSIHTIQTSIINSENSVKQYLQCKQFKQRIAQCYLHLCWYFFREIKIEFMTKEKMFVLENPPLPRHCLPYIRRSQ